MLVAVVFFFLVFRKALNKPVVLGDPQNTVNTSDGIFTAGESKKYPTAREAITNMRLFLIHTTIFLVVIILLVTHAQTGISVAMIGVVAAVLTLFTANRDAWHIFKKTDWRTLLFFIGLFIAVGGLEETGVLEKLAGYIGEIAGGNLLVVITIVIWVSAFASAVVDNIPFAATMVPVISGLAGSMGIGAGPLAWTLALGTDIGGNATPIGASANVVGTAIAEREGHPISWGKFLKYGIPSMVIVVALSWLLLYIRYV